MPGLCVTTSNRMEILADRLARVIAEPLSSPMTPEIVVVQSRGMARWLSMVLADRFGIWANCDYPFPNTFLQKLFNHLLPDLPEASPFAPDVLAFRIMALLPACLDQPGYEMLRRYIENDDYGLKCFQLARKIADLFDQYLVFRPDMILRWEAGGEGQDPDEKWQADLWRRLVAVCGNLHRARLMSRLIRVVDSRPDRLPELPQRISVFGISHLPLFHLQALGALARRVPVHFFLMNPCREYWGDIMSEGEIKKIRSSYEHRLWSAAGGSDQKRNFDNEVGFQHPPGPPEGGTLHEEDLSLEGGNPLLASMGKMGRDFFKLICGLDVEMADFYEAPPMDNLLGAVQSDILDLRDRSAGLTENHRETDGPAPGWAVLPTEAAIQIHSCHSPMREVEVLYDSLLGMFEADPSLNPRDIGIMTPDIEAYAPVIQAVFGAQPEEGPRIPFSVADQSVRRQNRAVEAFLSILSFKESRFGAAQVMTLLETPAIRARFELDDEEVAKALHWVRETRIRWGLDGASRQDLGLPRYEENTWKAGVDRLLLGYAMPGEGRAMFGGVLPYDHVEGNDWQPLEKFLNFLDSLFETARGLRQVRTLSEWRSFLMDTLDRFLIADESTETSLQVIREVLDDLGGYQEQAGFDQAIALEPVKAFVAERLAHEQVAHGFLSGGVTFCALLPMRNIPFKIICLIGMNIDGFPRDTRAMGFDLIARHPRPGDRSRRTDDKYLFLEALVSARQRLYISYVGRSIQDNTPIPPSVLVSELLDYLQDGFGIAPRDLVTEHRLQAFSPAYFSGHERLFSYSQENLEAAVGLIQSKEADPTPFISRGLDLPSDEWRRIDLDSLERFFRNPSRFILKQRLGLDLESGPIVPEERESFDLDGLERFLLTSELVEGVLRGEDTSGLFDVHRAAGRLPPGATGETVFDGLRVEAGALVERVRGLVEPNRLEGRSVEIEIGRFSISGRLEGITPSGLVHVHPGKGTGARQLRTWIHHLILGAVVEPGKPAGNFSYLVCRDKTWVFGSVQDSPGTLGALLERYWQGLTRPLPFFSESSLAYAEQALVKSKPREAALKSARTKWRPNAYGHALSESENPYHDLCFGVSKGAPEPFGETFILLAEEIYGPLLQCRRELD